MNGREGPASASLCTARFLSRQAALASDFDIRISRSAQARAPNAAWEELGSEGKGRGAPDTGSAAARSATGRRSWPHCIDGPLGRREARAPASVHPQTFDGDAERQLLVVRCLTTGVVLLQEVIPVDGIGLAAGGAVGVAVGAGHGGGEGRGMGGYRESGVVECGVNKGFV